MESKARPGGREGRERVAFENSAPNTRLFFDGGAAFCCIYGGGVRLVGIPLKRESIVRVVSSWVGCDWACGCDCASVAACSEM